MRQTALERARRIEIWKLPIFDNTCFSAALPSYQPDDSATRDRLGFSRPREQKNYRSRSTALCFPIVVDPDFSRF